MSMQTLPLVHALMGESLILAPPHVGYHEPSFPLP